MTHRPKQRSFRYYIIVVFSLLVPFIGLMIYATYSQPYVFFLMAVAMTVDVLILVLFYNRLRRKKSQAKVEKEGLFERANLLKVDLEREQAIIASLRDKTLLYSQLQQLVERLCVSLSREDTVAVTCREVATLFRGRDVNVLLYLVDEKGELAIVHASRQRHPISVKQKQGDFFDRWVLRNLQPLFSEDLGSDFRFDVERGDIQRDVASIVSIPLLVQNRLLGILRLDCAQEHAFEQEDLRFLRTIGDIAAVALENAHLFDRLQEMAIRDALTGLSLRRYFMDRLSEEVARHIRKDQSLCLAVIDLDHFKTYNDTFGHTAGDIVLAHVGKLIAEHFNAPGELPCRYGGEEFCVLMPETSLIQAQEKLENFIRSLALSTIILRRQETHVTASAGLAALPVHAKTATDLIRKADEALYRAKKDGRDRLVVALHKDP